ncbi:hypothetical protein SAV14893_080850 [Streptomyces avermitilis]|uniref:Uncharacterized protein n=1 Tax=Streptomyces avermitilis TaxID=33903 RepID=A0A4D4MFY3_STRAX|nr:hypothetical protein SAV14893_080850 [Streptomyces avermitilis]GDY70932.1 hypothetical protein SAV31267_004170 [Streptomyces avermitilis]
MKPVLTATAGRGRGRRTEAFHCALVRTSRGSAVLRTPTLRQGARVRQWAESNVAQGQKGPQAETIVRG